MDSWSEWLAVPGPARGSLDAEIHMAVLLGQFRARPSVEALERILVGDTLIEVARRTVERLRAPDVMETARAHYDRVIGQTAEGAIDIVCYRRLPSLFEMARDGDISRTVLVDALESACRHLEPNDPEAGLRLGRAVFQTALLTGRAPRTHEVQHEREAPTIARRTVEPWRASERE